MARVAQINVDSGIPGVGGRPYPPIVPNDHHVPQVYLRRFAVKRKQRHYLLAAEVSDMGKRWETNVANVGAEGDFYTFLTSNGAESRDLEAFFGRLESAAVPALRTILDDPEYALPRAWPLPPQQRLALSWFMAAQIVRSTRQRKRLEGWAKRERADMPGALTMTDLATLHAQFIVAAVGGLAAILASRPWGLAHSTACLPASDCPMLILNGQDDDDQLSAAAYWDIAFPLDPHRLIFMPGLPLIEKDPYKAVDHRIKLDGLGYAIADAIYSTADRFIYMHPDHQPHFYTGSDGRLAAPGSGVTEAQYVISYRTLSPEWTVAKRWATLHQPPRREGQMTRPGESFGLRY